MRYYFLSGFKIVKFGTLLYRFTGYFPIINYFKVAGRVAVNI